MQYFGHLMRRVDSLEKTLMLGGIGGKRRRRRQRMRWLDGITDSMDVTLRTSGSWWWTGRPGVLRFMGSQRVRHGWATDLIWSDLMTCLRTCRKDKRISRTHKYGCITVKVMVSMLEVSLDFICVTIFVLLLVNTSFTSIHCLMHVNLYSI